MSLSEAIHAARRRHGLAGTDAALVLPAYQGRLAPLPRMRRRAFTRHLTEAIAEAVAAPATSPIRPEPPIAPGLAALAGAACACCRGHCCSRGGEHAYLDADTIRRLRRAEPGLGRAAILARYRAALGPESYEGSCVFHGPSGCRLDRALRSDLCNTFYCNDLKRFLRTHPDAPPHTLLLAHDGEQTRRTSVHRAASVPAPATPAAQAAASSPA
ncbi:MAG: hypothetical protein ACREFY_04640 [Acetobacteraceae bacterium]